MSQSKFYTFGDRLSQLMTERKLYSTDIAKITGIKRQSIDGYAQGVNQPSAFSIAQIAKGLRVSADWLLGLTEQSEYDRSSQRHTPGGSN